MFGSVEKKLVEPMKLKVRALLAHCWPPSSALMLEFELKDVLTEPRPLEGVAMDLFLSLCVMPDSPLCCHSRKGGNSPRASRGFPPARE